MGKSDGPRLLVVRGMALVPRVTAQERWWCDPWRCVGVLGESNGAIAEGNDAGAERDTARGERDGLGVFVVRRTVLGPWR